MSPSPGSKHQGSLGMLDGHHKQFRARQPLSLEPGSGWQSTLLEQLLHEAQSGLAPDEHANNK